MEGLLKKGKGIDNIGLENIEIPIIEKNEVKIKVNAAGICGTDIHILKDEYPAEYPVVLGHEYSGIIEEVGDNVTEFQKGDRVVSHTAAVTCGYCKYCTQNLLMLCENRKSIGSGVHGAFTSYLKIPQNLVYKIPNNISLDEAVLSEPLACVVRSVMERSSVSAGDNVLISGPGTIGLLTLQVVIANGGNATVVGTDADKERLKLATTLGASQVLNVNEKEQDELFKRIQGEFDIAFECSGVATSADNCLKMLKKTGLYVQVGLYGEKINFDHDLALMKEIKITNSYASEPSSWQRALRLLELGLVNVEVLISDKLPLKEWKKGFATVEQKRGYKVLLYPEAEN